MYIYIDSKLVKVLVEYGFSLSYVPELVNHFLADLVGFYTFDEIGELEFWAHSYFRADSRRNL